MKKILTSVLSIALVLALLLLTVSCGGASAGNLMDEIAPEKVEGKKGDDKFKMAQINFSLELFAGVATDGRDDNILLSPVSAMYALAMLANGAEGETLSQMEEALGGISIGELNEYLYSFAQTLSKTDFTELYNSIWLRSDGSLSVNKDFLQKNANYYDSEVFSEAFDADTAKKINAWADEKTRGMIKEVVNEAMIREAVLLLANATVFEADWKNPFDSKLVKDGYFTTENGEKQKVSMMSSTESTYLEAENAVGFKKYYSGGKYSFVALLPNDGDVYSYLENLEARELSRLLSQSSREDVRVSVTMPKFKGEYEKYLNSSLKAMGMERAFCENAEFFGLGSSSQGNIYVDFVKQNTFIELDEKGTKAAAVTVIGTYTSSAATITNIKKYEVKLDRPFVYFIVEEETDLPVFMGIVTDLSK